MIGWEGISTLLRLVGELTGRKDLDMLLGPLLTALAKLYWAVGCVL